MAGRLGTRLDAWVRGWTPGYEADTCSELRSWLPYSQDVYAVVDLYGTACCVKISSTEESAPVNPDDSVLPVVEVSLFPLPFAV